MYQNQWQQNYSFAQDFIYNNQAENIIVGSSMAARMRNEFFPQDFFNLSFVGGSVLTGLEIIKKSGFVPRTIYIENNIIFRSKDEKFLHALFYPLLYKVKKQIPALQEKYQPLNILLSTLKGSYGKTREEYMEESQNIKVFSANIPIQKKAYSTPLTDYQKELDALERLISYFEESGAEVLFFEMPIDAGLADSIKAKQQREIIWDRFKKNIWLQEAVNSDYATTDGVHLLYKSAYKYSKVFLMEAQRRKRPADGYTQ